MHERKVGIIGAGGQADEAISYLKNTDIEFQALTEDYINPDNSRQINILTPTEYQKALEVITAIGAPAVRRAMVEKWPGAEFMTIQAETSYVDQSAKIGKDVIISPRAVITTNVEVGDHTIINVAATISHNCKLGEYVTVSPGAHIAGNVELGDGVFVGIGAIVSNGIKVANGSVIGAGAVVIKNILEENSVVVGTPAKIIRVNEGWLERV